ncbi:uncharacterized protein LOC116000435 isoform X3 [Ipomoea triloba]|uniref:uncharacterized protein LOC116000435 isoform X3 n=1 Tax=Ipomoea triloba TaxID=35885 RepID=UPI00125D14E0|nr:uncharacterized protein LOC116000435 isoform X3 [Ipomoea triloba]
MAVVVLGLPFLPGKPSPPAAVSTSPSGSDSIEPVAMMFILARDISAMNTRSALRVCVVRAYDIPERNASSILKSKELVFHNQEW